MRQPPQTHLASLRFATNAPSSMRPSTPATRQREHRQPRVISSEILSQYMSATAADARESIDGSAGSRVTGRNASASNNKSCRSCGLRRISFASSDLRVFTLIGGPREATMTDVRGREISNSCRKSTACCSARSSFERSRFGSRIIQFHGSDGV